ncbi:MAG: beta-ketoacyl-ACP synthase III [Dethiobacteria bacterium]|jgi:3-oxoacyl-[acyl-carrier-protein] synthase-3
MESRRAVGIISTGRALPVGHVSNLDLEEVVETSDQWITSRTGIKERRIISNDETCSELATIASKIALERAGLRPEDIDLLIVATVTPDQPLPSTACLVQAKLNACNAAAFDLAAGCTGFLYGLSVAEQYIKAGALKNVLLVGVDTLSSLVDWQDRNTCVLFGDGAGAVVLTTVKSERGLLASKLFSDGHKAGLLYVPGGGSRFPASLRTIEERLHYIKMNGPEIFKFAVNVMIDSTLQVLKMCGKTPDDLDYLLPHQANLRIINFAVKRLGLKPEQVLVNIHRYGNTSSASIPVLLDEAVEQGKIKEGDLLALVSFGAGLTWGAAVLNWVGEEW